MGSNMVKVVIGHSQFEVDLGLSDWSQVIYGQIALNGLDL